MEVKVEQIQKVEEMQKRFSNLPDLVIRRVPRKELEWFKAYAHEEFEGDYGMLLKWLCQGYMPPENMEYAEALTVLTAKVAELEMQIALLRKQSSAEDDAIVLGNGKRIVRRM